MPAVQETRVSFMTHSRFASNDVCIGTIVQPQQLLEAPSPKSKPGDEPAQPEERVMEML